MTTWLLLGVIAVLVVAVAWMALLLRGKGIGKVGVGIGAALVAVAAGGQLGGGKSVTLSVPNANAQTVRALLADTTGKPRPESTIECRVPIEVGDTVSKLIVLSGKKGQKMLAAVAYIKTQPSEPGQSTYLAQDVTVFGDASIGVR